MGSAFYKIESDSDFDFLKKNTKDNDFFGQELQQKFQDDFHISIQFPTDTETDNGKTALFFWYY